MNKGLEVFRCPKCHLLVVDSMNAQSIYCPECNNFSLVRNELD